MGAWKNGDLGLTFDGIINKTGVVSGTNDSPIPDLDMMYEPN